MTDMNQVPQTPPCILCGQTLFSPDFSDTTTWINQPMGGTAFLARGHYGSMFDPMRGNVWLEINICDACLTKASGQNRVLLGQQVHEPPPTRYSPYTPDTAATETW